MLLDVLLPSVAVVAWWCLLPVVAAGTWPVPVSLVVVALVWWWWR